MLWLSSLALGMATAALLAAFVLWRRVRRLQDALKERKNASPSGVRAPFDSVELSLEAMLEELEEKGREVLRRIERREEELSRVFAHGDLFRWPDQTTRSALFYGAAPAGRREPPPEAPPPEEAASSKAEAVRRLAEEGLDDLEIAKRLGIGRGEVRLILGLKH